MRDLTSAALESSPADAYDGDDDGDGGSHDTFEMMFRVLCPDCSQPIALLEGEDRLPEHARITSQWNPFGLQVCEGTGRAADGAAPADDTLEAQEQDAGLLLTLPAGLDWRRQPFSHVGGPGSTPVRLRIARLRRR